MGAGAILVKKKALAIGGWRCGHQELSILKVFNRTTGVVGVPTLRVYAHTVTAKPDSPLRWQVYSSSVYASVGPIMFFLTGVM